MVKSPCAGASKSLGSSITALEPGDCARDDAARFAKGAFYDEREGAGADCEYLGRMLQFVGECFWFGDVRERRLRC